MFNQKRNLLLVDDDPLIGEVISKIADEQGYTTTAISSSRNFNDHYSSNVDVIILDLFMPDIDGIELLRYMAVQNCDSSLILISGGNMSIFNCAIELAKQQGLRVIGSLRKPFRVQQLKQLLNSTQPPLPAAANKKIEISESDIQRALQHNEFSMVFQPQISMDTRRLVGVEALLRWQHPRFGSIPPAYFIPLIENTVYINPLTEYVIGATLASASELLSINPDLNISINISAKNLNDLSLPDRLLNELERYNISPTQVTIEVTETAICDDDMAYMDILTRLRMKGINLSIDDFGTGYSSLAMLTKVPFNELKIDQYFTQKVVHDKECQSVISAALMLAEKLDMQVVAEGVESKEVFDILRQQGCKLCQGYWVSKPQSINSLFDWSSVWQQQIHQAQMVS